MFMEVLVEGNADVPAVSEILQRRFNLTENIHFRVHPHRGKGRLPENVLSKPDTKKRGLLDQLPAKLRGFGRNPGFYCVVVLVDADDDNCRDLKSDLIDVYQKIDSKPSCVLFRIAVEETESWFIADTSAIETAYPSADLSKLPGSPPDSKIGAWECLARTLGRNPDECIGADKIEWAKRISPHLDLDDPRSPSLKAFVLGINGIIGHVLS
jgi:hypothetical protein